MVPLKSHLKSLMAVQARCSTESNPSQITLTNKQNSAKIWWNLLKQLPHYPPFRANTLCCSQSTLVKFCDQFCAIQNSNNQVIHGNLVVQVMGVMLSCWMMNISVKSPLANTLPLKHHFSQPKHQSPLPKLSSLQCLLPFSTGIWSFSLKLVEIRRLPKSMKTRWNLKSSFFPLNWYSWCCPRIQSEYLFHCPWCCSHRRVGGAHLLVPAAAPTPPFWRIFKFLRSEATPTSLTHINFQLHQPVRQLLQL